MNVNIFDMHFAYFQYLGKTHNLWHRAVLMLEQMAFDNGLSTQLVRPKPAASEYEFEPVTSPQQVSF